MTRWTWGTTLIALLLFSPKQIATQENDDSWDVEASLGPAETLSFEATEGTWMNVDVSPDGQTIVFDLLGDIYTMPITGGVSTLLRGGQAFEMQPRFSPDGSRIAFISDRDGNFNIWSVDPDGRDPRQVSKEDSREVNSPAWSGDGQYIFGRKHFVNTRSLGAGEVWMYHASGTGGLQVVERNGWEKDLGEPEISPDGKYLYYSRNVWPGQQFQYNKDPNRTIYSIRRVDLDTGEETTVTSRPGGSITPQISPDGTRMSFIRRVRLKSVLFIRDLVTGEEWPLWDGLERDMQEAWAIHGVYTQYAWLPDGTGIVIWARGKLWQVDTATGKAHIIPFSAPVQQQVHAAVRFPQEVAPDRFDVKMLKDVVTSPDGRFVVYSALGRLYIKDMPQGRPRRLTREDVIEFSPAFSPDGSWIVYATWTDRGLGRIRIIRTDGTSARDVVTEPGHYTEPGFSPNGSTLVYRSTRGDLIRGLTHAQKTGIYVVPVDGAADPQKVRQSGHSPSFDHTGERIYVNQRGEDGLSLLSVELDGGNEIVHFESLNAIAFVPSPDGEWIAFTERFRAYLAAFPRTGRTVTLEPDAPFPMAQVSDNAGTDLHWSADSKSLHWILGAEYFSRDLTRTFDFVAGGSADSADPETSGLNIGFSQPFDKPTGWIALVGARVITMAAGSEDGGVIEDATVLINENRIVQVGRRRDVRIPTGTQTVNVTGMTIMPGIVDVHAHVGGESNGILTQQSWPLAANLAFGVTTSHDPSNNTETVFTNAEMIKAGFKLGPRLFSTGTILYGAETNFKAIVNSYDDALRHLSRMKAVGAFSVKSYNQRRRDSRQMIIKAARQLEMMVVPEGGSLLYNNMTMVMDGHTTVEHSMPVPRIYEDLANLFAAGSTGYTPTLVVSFGGLSGEYYWYEHTNVWENERLLAFTPRDVVDPRSRRRIMAAGDDDFNHIAISVGAKVLQDSGTLVTLGAHGQMQGLGAHWELWSLHQGGMTEEQALRAATLDGAKVLGMDSDIGSIEVGKLADLIILYENPLEDIRNSESVNMVMLNGRLYDGMTLNQLGNHPSERAPFWFERVPGDAPGGAGTSPVR